MGPVACDDWGRFGHGIIFQTMTTITRARIHSTASLVLCDLARARRRAGLTLARLHKGDEVWRAALARDYFAAAQQKWSEFLATSGEQRAVARYEFLADFDAWIHSFCPLNPPGEQGADLLVAGMFGNDAIMVSNLGSGRDSRGRRKKQKLYRIFRNDGGGQKFPSLLRLPQTESLFLGGGEDAIALDTADDQDDRIICGFDTLLVVARQADGQTGYRVVRPGEKLVVTPASLALSAGTFVPAGGVLKQAKAALGAMGRGAGSKEPEKTRIYRITPSHSDGPEVEASPHPAGSMESTEIVGSEADGIAGPAPGTARVQDRLIDTNKGIIEEVAPDEMRPSISTALRLSENTLIAIQGDLMAVESDAQAISDRQAKLEDAGQGPQGRSTAGNDLTETPKKDLKV